MSNWPAIYHGGKITLDEMIYTLYAMLEFNSVISLKKICPRVDMSVESDTLSLIRANQSLLLLLNVACLSEKHHIINNTTESVSSSWHIMTIIMLYSVYPDPCDMRTSAIVNVDTI